ncbi:MAG TPA: methyltransferase domain-containing protein [Gaiellales bacterium]|nr:methyltransferase domain-containing protein [Gaiellales bacterium]
MSRLAERRQAARRVWAAGDYDVIAGLIWEVGARIVHRLEVGPGDDVLDVACGTGNAAIPAARAGGRVVGLDVTPEMFTAARARAAGAGVAVEWIEGDAEALPFADHSFDVVVSTFGAMFAPRHEVAAAEIVRVLRPGGRLGICSWVPEGNVGEFFRLMAEHVPPPPGPPPTRWGSEAHVRELFDDAELELTLERELVTLRFDSIEHAVQTYETKFGPVVKAREQLAPEARWTAMRDDLAEMFQRHSEIADGGVSFAGEYLVLIAHRQDT